jgi:hypothetical protein
MLYTSATARGLRARGFDAVHDIVPWEQRVRVAAGYDRHTLYVRVLWWSWFFSWRGAFHEAKDAGKRHPEPGLDFLLAQRERLREAAKRAPARKAA